MVDGEGNVGLAVPISVAKVFGTEAGQVCTLDKSVTASTAGASFHNPQCSQCGSTSLYRAGFRYLEDGSPVQRWLCRKCSYRFSEKPLQKNSKCKPH